MAKILEPSSQFLAPNPNQHINYVFGTSSTIEEYRTARYLNQIIKIFGTDVVIKGLDTNTYSLNSNTFSITINPGVLIQDSTLIEVLYSFTKQLTSLSSTVQSSDNYYIVLYTTFQFNSTTTVPTTNPNSFNISIGILNNTTHVLYNQDPTTTGTAISWDTNTNRIVIFAAPITELSNVPVTVNISGYTYTIRASRSGSSVFNYDTIDCFNVDGGNISQVG